MGCYRSKNNCYELDAFSDATRLTKLIWKQATPPPLVTDPLIAAMQNCSTATGVNMQVHLIYDSLG